MKLKYDAASQIRFEHCKPIHLNALSDYRLPKEQAIFTTLPLDAVKVCEEDHHQYPVAIFSGYSIIGFFVLHSGEGANAYTDNADAVVFKSFSIDRRYQGKNLATESLKLLPSFTRSLFPNKNEIILTVHYTNIPAQNLYEKCGFLDKGLRYEGEYGEEIIFHKKL